MNAEQSTFEAEVASGGRFKFGENWESFLGVLDDERIQQAQGSLIKLLGRERLDGIAVLDIGSGSGLFSLAARRLGALVTSLDFDPHSVNCAKLLRNREGASDAVWSIVEGSVLDDGLMQKLGTFDVVYSWGVLHHTGEMYHAISNAMGCVRAGGQLALALYRKTWFCTLWRVEKRLYCSSPPKVQQLLRATYRATIGLAHRVKYGDKKLERGMDAEHDLHDWLGGYPYESITPRELREFVERRGFGLRFQHIRSEGLSVSPGCDEYMFERGR